MSKSRFDDLLSARRRRSEAEPEEHIETTPATAEEPSNTQAEDTTSVSTPEAEIDNTIAEEPRRGRPKGRRSDPSYVPTSVRLPVELYVEMKKKLLDLKITGQDMDYEELVAYLVKRWLAE